MGAKVKAGNIKLTISLPETTNDLIRSLCKKHGDLSKIIDEALLEKYQPKPAQ